MGVVDRAGEGSLPERFFAGFNARTACLADSEQDRLRASGKDSGQYSQLGVCLFGGEL